MGSGALVDLRDIVRERGGELYAGGRKAVVPGPGHSRNDRSLSLSLGEGGRVLFNSFANDSVRDCMEYLGLEPGEGRQSTPAERARERALREHERRTAEAADLALCRTIWDGSQRLDGSPAETYLWSRKLLLEGVSDIAYHPAAPRWKWPKDGEPIPTHPAMVAVVRDVRGAPKGLHLTFIKPDGSGKAFGDRSRLMFGPVGGHAVQIGRPADGVLAVGEGIETCGAYATLKGLACWPALSTAGVSSFVVPPRVRRLVIAADNDKGGMAAAVALAERAAKVCDVEIDPAPVGQDWAQVLEDSR